MKKALLILAVISLFFSCSQSKKAVEQPTTPERAIELLKEQNELYQKASQNDGDISAFLREETVENGQHPYAAVLTCADSRVVPEHIFMEGISRLFTIRNAGNIVDNTVLGSVEYAVAHLGSKVVLVLGHTQCGAVSATIANAGHDHISSITDTIAKGLENENDPRNAEIKNVQYSIEQLFRSEIITNLVAETKIKVVGAIYNAQTGAVEFLD